MLLFLDEVEERTAWEPPRRLSDVLLIVFRGRAALLLSGYRGTMDKILTDSSSPDAFQSIGKAHGLSIP